MESNDELSSVVPETSFLMRFNMYIYNDYHKNTHKKAFRVLKEKQVVLFISSNNSTFDNLFYRKH